jgi:hypothetical protein
LTNFIYQASPWMLPTVMLVVLGLAIELPYRFRQLLSAQVPKIDPINVLQAALLTLSAFVVSLSFSQASARYDSRRAVTVAEANAIGTTWFRANQLDPAQTRLFRHILVDDTAARLATYQRPYDAALYRQMSDRASRDQARLWDIASSALQRHDSSQGLSLLAQSVNNMIDIIAQQRQSLASHVPTAIIVLTLCLVTLAALSLGIRFALEGSRPVMLSAIYVIAYVIVISMMIDYDRPNTGFVTVSVAPMTEQLHSMQEAP